MLSDIRFEWRIDGIERSINNKADKNEIYQINSNVDRLEYSIKELNSVVDRLRFELETTQDQMRKLLATTN